MYLCLSSVEFSSCYLLAFCVVVTIFLSLHRSLVIFYRTNAGGNLRKQQKNQKSLAGGGVWYENRGKSVW